MNKTIVLFDVDGTLTPARKEIKKEMLQILIELKKNKNLDIGFVGGSDLKKQIEQLKKENFYLFDWKFSENGLLGYYQEECIHSKSFVKEITETHYKKLINIILSVLSELDCPVKRGTFIEFRNAMINVSPIGRACNQTEREEFYLYDQKYEIRKDMINKIQLKWNKYIQQHNLHNLIEIKYSIGGQISVDIFPKGWDKTYCLQFIENKYQEIHFFGDKTYAGGNDHEIYNDPRVIGHKVESYQDTIAILKSLFLQ